MSHASWPSTYYWAMLAEKYNVLYNNTAITYKRAKSILLSQSDTKDSDMVRETVQRNFIKVLVFEHLQQQWLRFSF